MPDFTRKVVPFGKRFENWRALLAHVAEDAAIEDFVIVTSDKEGQMGFAHFNMSRERLAYAALVIQRKALGGDDV